MPGGNGTGPMGMGSMTGRAAGFCAGFGMPGYANAHVRRGFSAGYGRGREFIGLNSGRGFRRMFKATGVPGWMRFGVYDSPYQDPDPGLEKQMLKSQVKAMQSELDLIRKRLSEIETEASHMHDQELQTGK